MTRLCLLLLWLIAIGPAAAQVRPLQWDDLPAPARVLAGQLGITAASFPGRLAEIDRRTGERVQEGEFDHLVYYVLQAKRFTTEPPIEPARSAVAYAESPSHRIPSEVERRIADFARIVTPQGERQQYFARLLAGADPAATLRREYSRAMGFLYAKEVLCRRSENPQQCVAELYENRGHSSDTSEQSLRAIRAGVAWLGKPVKRVLIVGPGADFAPRTGLHEDGPPRVYQPAAVAKEWHAMVDCADINPRVLDEARGSCSATYRLNLVTETLEHSGYDLIIATNVLLYMNDAELLLAMNSVRAMLQPGGAFLHNDARFAAKVFGEASGLPAVKFGEVMLDKDRKPPLTDRFVIHVKPRTSLQ